MYTALKFPTTQAHTLWQTRLRAICFANQANVCAFALYCDTLMAAHSEEFFSADLRGETAQKAAYLLATPSLFVRQPKLPAA